MIGKMALSLCFMCLVEPVVARTELPNDVARFIAKRESCDHFRGEIPSPGDKIKMKELNRMIQKWCSGTDRTLAQLKRKYAEDEAVLNQLGEFEPNIEVARKLR
ncbi:hypothetical protein [Massilia sp. TWR1-2-2]|uniref:hypothetical protein n=1 Tax=Massilia sp. TWR1-2-2 TaxID=2804584 RepID=UPI003CF25A23